MSLYSLFAFPLKCLSLPFPSILFFSYMLLNAPVAILWDAAISDQSWVLTGITYWFHLTHLGRGNEEDFQRRCLGLGQAPKCSELSRSKYLSGIPSGSLESNSSCHINSKNVSQAPKVLRILKKKQHNPKLPKVWSACSLSAVGWAQGLWILRFESVSELEIRASKYDAGLEHEIAKICLPALLWASRPPPSTLTGDSHLCSTHNYGQTLQQWEPWKCLR